MQPYHIGVITPDDQLAGRIRDALTRPGVEVVTSGDPRAIKTWMAGTKLDLLAFDCTLMTPSATDLGRALFKAFAGHPALVHLAPGLNNPDEPAFVAQIKRTVAPRVLADRLLHLAHAARAGESDDTELRAEAEVAGLRADDATHYDVLGVTSTAPADAIKAAYDRISLVLHPDRLRRVKDDALRERATSLYGDVQAAYETLRNGAERARYNRELKGKVVGSRRLTATLNNLSMENWSDSAPVRKALRTAQQALQAKDPNIALVQLRFALQLEPDNEQIASKIAELEPSAP
jgi:hypothetical protein